MALSHEQLAASLAAHLTGGDRMVWTDIQLGPSGSPRPDVYTLMKSFANPLPTAYECKVSRSDFLSDVTSGKWQTYLVYAGSVVFACEGDIIKKSDVPGRCGLMRYNPTLLDNGHSGWSTSKRPISDSVNIPQDALLKLLIDGVRREGPVYRARRWTESIFDQKIFKKYGDVVARVVRDRMAVEYEIEDARRRAEAIVNDAQKRAERVALDGTMKVVEPARRELCEALGLPQSASHWEIRRKVQEISAAAKENPDTKKIRELTNALRRTLEHYGCVEEPENAEVV